MPPLTNRLRAYPIRQVVQPLGSIADGLKVETMRMLVEFTP